MSDHIDGPRTTADPSVDLTDLFAFASPQSPGKTVLVADVLPFAGEVGFFSNVADYSIIVRRTRVAGLGPDAAIGSYGPTIKFTFQFDVLSRASSDGSAAAQAGSCILPSGEVVPVTVGDEAGSYSKDKSIRVFAGVRSDPFYIGWVLNTMESVPNYLQNDNVMGLVVECDLNAFFPADDGTLFGVVAESTPRHRTSNSLLIPRYDWVGRPEQTNFIINAIPNTIDLRDLWNQQQPFADFPTEVAAVFRQRLSDSFAFWDARDGETNWPPDMLAAHVNLRLADFLVFDTAKPITDQSHLEIEKATLDGKPYVTGGGRTINANVIDILVTYLINRDQGKFYQSRATQATQPGRDTFPYLAPPNQTLLKITSGADLAASITDVWDVVGQFSAIWNPLVASVSLVGEGLGQLRKTETIDGKVLWERLDALSSSDHVISYSLVSGIPAEPLLTTIRLSPATAGCNVAWEVSYRPSGQGDLIVHLIIKTMMDQGIAGLRKRFGTSP